MLKVGDWVVCEMEGNTIYGYVVYLQSGDAKIQTPRRVKENKSAINVRRNELTLWESSITSRDLDTLIELSLEKRDEKWFHELTERQKKTKSY